MNRCKSCGAEIVWCFTDRGKRIPVDAVASVGGNLRQIVDTRGVRYATVAGATTDLLDESDDGIRYMPHHATCPDAKEWKR